jgi:pyrroline-5-carboxylate reductase
MPNTPSLVQAGASGLFANAAVTEDQKQQATAIMNAVGLSCWLDNEQQLDAVTALSGSGPAYFFLMMEAMEAAGTKLGLSPEVARQLCLQTAFGAAKLALKQFEEDGYRDIVERALTAAAMRSAELAFAAK